MPLVLEQGLADEQLLRLYSRLLPSVWDLAARVVRSEEAAKDVVVRIFARARAESSGRSDENGGRLWLFGIAASELKVEQPAPPPYSDAFSNLDVTRLAGPLGREEGAADAVWSCAAALPVSDYLVLDLQARRGLSDRELAAALGLDPRTIERRIEAARAKLEAVVAPLPPLAIFAALAPLPVPAGIEQAIWNQVMSSSAPRTQFARRRPDRRARGAVVAAAVIALLAGALAAGAYYAARGGEKDLIAVRSTSHSVDHGSENPNVAVSWTPATGSRGYSVSWTAEPEDPDTSVDLPGEALATTGHLSPGTSWFNVRTLGADGRWSKTVHLGPFVILPDTTSPETTISKHPLRFGPPAAEFVFESNEDWARLECSLDRERFATCTSPKTYEQLQAGVHTFRVRSVDGAGNTDRTPARIRWTVDSRPPATTLTGRPDAYARGVARFEFESSEKHSSFRCKLDEAPFGDCASPRTYRDLDDGSHRFRVKALDRAGNADHSPATLTWVVDTKPPETTIDSGPPAASHKPTATFTLSSEVGAEFECRLDRGEWGACGEVTGLEDGRHVLRARARDRAGNADPTPARYSWRVDLPPETSLTSGPRGLTASASATFRFSSPDSTASFQCRLDGGKWVACSSGKTYSSVGQGSYVFRVRARDASGTADPSPARREWTVDTIAPNTTITAGPHASTGSGSASISFSASEAGSSFQCRLDDGRWRACSSPRRLSGLTNGPHVFRVRAVDAAGNADATPDAWSWTVH